MTPILCCSIAYNRCWLQLSRKSDFLTRRAVLKPSCPTLWSSIAVIAASKVPPQTRRVDYPQLEFPFAMSEPRNVIVAWVLV